MSNQKPYEKWVVRDGKVAIIISPGFGAGWYSWNIDKPQLLFDPEIVRMLEEKLYSEIEPYCEKVYGEDGYYRVETLKIEWVPVGVLFHIHEYYGAESVVRQDEEEWFIAGWPFYTAKNNKRE